MKTFTLTDLAHRSGEVAQAAHRGPVAITSRGKRTFVLIAADQFDAISGSSGRRALHVDDLGEQEASEIMRGLREAAEALENG